MGLAVPICAMLGNAMASMDLGFMPLYGGVQNVDWITIIIIYDRNIISDSF